MSRLEQLIAEFCPDGVEYVAMKDIKEKSFWLMPATPNYISEGIPYITSKNIKNGTIDFTDAKYISQSDFEAISSNRKIEENDLLITMIGTIGEAAFVNSNTNFYGQNMYLIRLNSKKVNRFYFYYFVTSPVVRNELISKKNASSQGYIKAGSLENLKIPLPPMPVQQEIVRILGKFTELIAELTAELTARRKQYEYYRDLLLTFGDDISWCNLEEILKIRNGKDYKSFNVGDIPVYGSGGIITYIDTFAYDKPSVLIPRKGSIDKLYYVEKPFWTVDTVFYTEICTCKVIPKYVFYCLQKERLEQYNTAGGVPSLTQAVLNKVKIPVPPIEEQQRIVAILNRFDALCNDLTSGLPAEIEARQKQYEYYRDKLLTFKEAKA